MAKKTESDWSVDLPSEEIEPDFPWLKRVSLDVASKVRDPNQELDEMSFRPMSLMEFTQDWVNNLEDDIDKQIATFALGLDGNGRRTQNEIAQLVDRSLSVVGDRWRINIVIRLETAWRKYLKQ